jgi:two-component system nitrate/nitrite response regulator NarL
MVGEKVFPTRFTAEALNGRLHDEPADERGHGPGGLSRREAQIVHHLVDGHSNKAIANALGITEATVKVHLRTIMKKTKAANRTQLAVWGLNNGLDHSFGGGAVRPERPDMDNHNGAQ